MVTWIHAAFKTGVKGCYVKGIVSGGGGGKGERNSLSLTLSHLDRKHVQKSTLIIIRRSTPCPPGFIFAQIKFTNTTLVLNIEERWMSLLL
jgi:hypothetical protein